MYITQRVELFNNSLNKSRIKSKVSPPSSAASERDAEALVSSSASPRCMSITRPKAVARMVSKVNNL